MKKAMEERGKDWSSVNNVAKEALASAVTKRADEVANAHLIWVRSVGKRINQTSSKRSKKVSYPDGVNRRITSRWASR
jgi:hypothetical protein